ncbi:hypothetical protein [Nitrospira sp.]|uniref:hypothetical protein n=2 Tax=unclassified Nitrospira TaxID=2652172 RepID=UPI003FCDDD76
MEKRDLARKRMPYKILIIRLSIFMLGSLLFLPNIGPTPAYSAEETQEDALSILFKANGQLDVAMKYGELALSPNQPGSGWHRENVQRAMNVLTGKGGPDFDEKVENPGDGHGAINYLKEAHEALKGCRPINACDAIHSSLIYIEEALKHGKEALKTGHRRGISERQIRIFGALLEAARGNRNTESPILGALAYAIRVVEMEKYSKMGSS